MALNVGDLAPNFELPDTELKMRTLDEFKGKKIVLSFIVAASSPVCEVELCTFRDSWQEISDMGAQIISISNDGSFACPLYTPPSSRDQRVPRMPSSA